MKESEALKNRRYLPLLIEGARPKTLIAGAAPVFMGTAIAIKEGSFHPLCFVMTLLFALLIQIGTNLTNDFFDYLKGIDTAQRKGPRRLTESGLLPLQVMKKVIHLPFLLALLIIPYFVSIAHWSIAYLAPLAILCGYLYTAGPYPIGYLGLGELFILLFFGEIATAGTTYLQTKEISSIALIAGLAPGFFSVAILTANNLRDIEEDRKGKKKTLPVRFGYRFGQIEYAFALLFPFLIPPLLVWYTQRHMYTLSTLFLLFLSIPKVREVFSSKRERELLPLLSKTGKLFFYFTLCFCIGWLI